MIFRILAFMSRLKLYLPLLIILIYIILSIIKLDYPGFQYDELLFGNAALGDFDGTFVHKRILNIPVLLMPYIGALKAYFYYAIFLVFNPSYLSVRLPMILLTSVSLWLIYKFISEASNFSTAVLSIIFLASEPNFISLTRTDVGPVAIGLFFRSAALLYFFKFAKNHDSNNLIIVLGSLLLGFYDKLNFVWFINAFVLAAAVSYGGVFGNISKLIQTGFAKIVIGVFSLIFGVFIVLAVSLAIKGELSFIPTQKHLAIVLNNLLGLANGSVFYEYLFGKWSSSYALGWIVWTLIITGSILALRQAKSELKTFHFFNLLILILIFIQILLTDKAISSWHVFMLQPMMAIVTASSLIFVIKTIFAKNEMRQKAILTVSALTIFGTQFFTYLTYISNYEKPYDNIMWSKKIDELQTFTQINSNRFVSLDWGFHTQLLTLGGKPDKFYNLAFLLNEPLTSDQKQRLQSDLMNPEANCFFIMHSEETTLFKSARSRFFETAEQFGLQAELIKTFDEAGRPLYEIYQLKHK